jgi:hypothetical protein
MGARTRNVCRKYLMKVYSLPLQSQYVLSLVFFFVSVSKNQFAANCEIRGMNSRNKCNFHQSLSVLTSYQKGLHYFGIKVFSYIPEHINNINSLSHIMKQLKSALKGFLYLQYFCSELTAKP